MKSKNKNRRKVRVMHLICDASERAIVSIHTDANTKRANIEYVLPIEFPTQIEAMCEIETPTYGTFLGIALTNKMLLLIKDTKILSSKKLFPEPVTCMAFDGTYLWAITALSNEVIKIHPDTGETSVVMKLYPPSVYAPSTECYTMRYIQDSMWIFTDTRQYVVKISIKPPHICTLVNPNPFRVSTNSAQDTVIYLPTTCSLVTLNPDLAKIVNLKKVPKNTIAYNEQTNTYVVPYNTNTKLKHITIIPFETGLTPTACVCDSHDPSHMWLGYNYISDVKVLVEDNQQYFMYKVLTHFLFHDDIKPMAWIEDNTLALYPNERYSRSQIVPYYSKEQWSKVEAIKYLMQYQS